MTDKPCAHVMATACSVAPDGHDHWIVAFLGGAGGGIPEVRRDFVAAMEDVLDVVAEPYEPKRSVVCFDESPWQRMTEVRKTTPAKPGKPAREDTKYQRKGALYEAFPPQEARAIASKLEFHTTPKHGSWLNIAEIEWAVLANRCPDRIPDEETLRKHVETNLKERNTKAEPVKWRFNTQDARRKLARLYPDVST